MLIIQVFPTFGLAPARFTQTAAPTVLVELIIQRSIVGLESSVI